MDDGRADTTRIVVELQPHTTPICGELVPPGGPAVAFTGWLELTRVLEGLITDAAQRPTPSPAPHVP